MTISALSRDVRRRRCVSTLATLVVAFGGTLSIGILTMGAIVPTQARAAEAVPSAPQAPAGVPTARQAPAVVPTAPQAPAAAPSAPQSPAMTPSAPQSPSVTASAGVESPISVDTGRGRLVGSLVLPALPTPTPSAVRPAIVLMVAGSGPTDRDGNTAGAPGRNDSLKLLARALADRGIASVRFDKRGVGQSRDAMLDEAQLRFDVLVDDVAVWLRTLKADNRFGPLIVLGHSEGALLAMLAVQKSPADALVSLAGPASKASALLREQMRGRLPADLSQRSDEILGDLELGQSVAEVPQQLMVLFRPSVQPYLISWFKIVPTDEIARLRIPTLIVQGSHDIQVLPANAPALKQARPDAKLDLIDGMNHVLKLTPAELEAQRSAYTDPSLPIAPALVEAIVSFVASIKPASAVGAPAKP